MNDYVFHYRVTVDKEIVLPVPSYSNPEREWNEVTEDWDVFCYKHRHEITDIWDEIELVGYREVENNE